ncbi:hypothetical protein [Pseudonocardia adelaidensis]|uniref:Uncharacterized protein n=1 Tax=Pseudonocardia adelaidensis TaxID=648754 RepID=A0ABP9NM54_9PSEU
MGAGPGRDATAFERAALERHGSLESWETWGSGSDLHYQFAVLRTP